MKKLISVLFVLLVSLQLSYADTTSVANVDSVEKVASEKPQAATILDTDEIVVVEDVSIHQIVKDKFIEGGVLFMGIVLSCLIIGLAVAVERVLTLNMAYINMKKFIGDVESALNIGGVDAAKEVCLRVQGPIASIYYQGLTRVTEGLEAVEKSIIAYGSVEMGKLEKGLTWVSLFISLAPMLGFMGTVIGMIDAFDTIEQAEDIKIDEVASGIKVALLTTVAGLIVAVILQVFYNYLVSKIDALVNQMEESSVILIDMLIERDITSSK